MKLLERSHLPWTEEELANVESVIKSGKTVKACMELFPGRTFLAVKNKVFEAEGRKPRGFQSWVWDAIVRELGANPNLTGRMLAERIGCCYRQVMDMIYMHHRADAKSIHIARWMRPNKTGVGPGPWIQCWALGDLPDAAKPARMTPEEQLARDRAKYRVKARKANPFAVAAGLVQAPESKQGRVFKQDMEIDQWFQSRAA